MIMPARLIAAMTVFLVYNAVAGATTWTGLGDKLRWDDVLNWNDGLPVIPARTFINGADTTVLIDAATTATSGRFLLADDAETDDVTLNMTGGSLTVQPSDDELSITLGSVGKGTLNLSGGVIDLTGFFISGGFDFAAAQGIVNISGGTLNISGDYLMGRRPGQMFQQQVNMSSGALTIGARLFVDDDVPSSTGEPMALVNITGGTMEVGDLLIPAGWSRDKLNGRFDLHGGIVTVNNPSNGNTGINPTGLRLANGLDPVGGVNTVVGTMDITFGTLKLTGNALSVINTYIVTDDSLLAFGGTGVVVRDFDTTSPGFTTVTAMVLGDANRDGIVNIFDINLISSNWNTPGPTANVNGDDIVNIFDINAVSAHWMQSNPDGPTAGLVAANAVPEPATLVSLAVGALLFGVGFRRLRTMH